MIFDNEENVNRWKKFATDSDKKASREAAKYKPADNPEKLCMILFAMNERGHKYCKFKVHSLIQYCGLSAQEIGHYMPVLVSRGFVSVYTNGDADTYQKEFDNDELDTLIEQRVN